MIRRLLLTVALAATLCPVVNAQKYRYIDKTVAVVGNEPITLSMIEGEVKNQRARGMASGWIAQRRKMPAYIFPTPQRDS